MDVFTVERRSALMARIQGKEHKTRNLSTSHRIRIRLSLPIASAGSAWNSRSDISLSQENHLRSWMFLASAPRLSARLQAKIQYCVLGTEVLFKPHPRHSRTERTA